MHGRWKKHVTLIAAIALLAACGRGSDDSDPAANNHGFGFSFDAEFNGLRVRYADGGPHEPTAETLELWFQETIRCADTIGPPERAGLPVSPPLVVIVPMGENDPFDGFTYYDTGTITIERHVASDRPLNMHEFAHWLLHSRGVPEEVINAHTDVEFLCAFFNPA